MEVYIRTVAVKNNHAYRGNSHNNLIASLFSILNKLFHIGVKYHPLISWKQLHTI